MKLFSVCLLLIFDYFFFCIDNFWEESRAYQELFEQFNLFFCILVINTVFWLICFICRKKVSFFFPHIFYCWRMDCLKCVSIKNRKRFNGSKSFWYFFNFDFNCFHHNYSDDYSIVINKQCGSEKKKFSALCCLLMAIE